MMEWLFFDSSGFVFKVLNAHWLILGFAWGVFKVIAKRTKTTIDDEVVEVITELENRRKVLPDNK